MSTPATAYVTRCYTTAQATAENVKTHAQTVGLVYDRLTALKDELSAVEALAATEPVLVPFGIAPRLSDLLAALNSLQKEILGT